MPGTEVESEQVRIELPAVPGSKTIISQIAAIVVVIVPLLAHQLGFTNFPTIDESMVVPWITVVFGVGIMLHRYGLNTVAQYILIHLAPIVQQVVREEVSKMQLPVNVVATGQPPEDDAPALPSDTDLTRFAPLLDALGVQSTPAPSPQAFTINGKPYEPVDLLRLIESLRSAK
jgi:hypothetical protein